MCREREGERERERLLRTVGTFVISVLGGLGFASGFCFVVLEQRTSNITSKMATSTPNEIHNGINRLLFNKPSSSSWVPSGQYSKSSLPAHFEMQLGFDCTGRKLVVASTRPPDVVHNAVFARNASIVLDRTAITFCAKCQLTAGVLYR